MHYQWQIEARKGALMMFQGQRFGGASAMGNGLFGSIVGAMLVGGVVLAAVLIAQWVTLDLRAGLAMAALCLIPLSIYNVLVVRYLALNPLPYAPAIQGASPYSQAVIAAANQIVIPVLIGLVVGYVINVRTRDHLEREAYRPVVPAAQHDAEAAAQAAAARVATLDAAFVDYSKAQEVEVVQPAAPVATAAPVAPPEKRAITCHKCGASNVPLRSKCLRCGAALAT
jgi:hypothetical protein